MPNMSQYAKNWPPLYSLDQVHTFVTKQVIFSDLEAEAEVVFLPWKLKQLKITASVSWGKDRISLKAL